MAKNSFNDIVPPEQRSIRNIQRARDVRPEETREVPEVPHVAEEQGGYMPPSPPPPAEPPRVSYGHGSFFSRHSVWIVAFVVFLILVVALSLVFSGSSITVTPKEKHLTIDGVFSASHEALSGELSYDVMTVQDSVEKTVPASGTEYVDIKAEGTIIVFNDYSEKSQRLIPNTRFETPDGLVYRIQEAITVPGMTEDAEGNDVPGSIEVRVVADEPGDSYNIGLVDFTIPGFKGTPQYDGFYARSKTPMTGGFSGEQVKVESGTFDSIVAGLTNQLKEKLNNAIEEGGGGGTVTFPSGIVYVPGVPSMTDDGKGNATITLEGEAHAIVFNSNDLAAHITAATDADYIQGTPVTMDDGSGLTFTLHEDSSINPAGNEDIVFDLKGSTTITWLFDARALARDLSGRPQSEMDDIIKENHPGIQSAEGTLRPFWKQSFPGDPEKIKVEVKS